MNRSVGDLDSTLWLLGDSNPKNWENDLTSPLDPRHPIRHNIWTSVLDVIQDRVYRENRSRVDTSSLYIRNAIADPAFKPKPHDLAWNASVQADLVELRQLLGEHKPVVLVCFGAFAFEFARRALNQTPARNYGLWGAKELGVEFKRRIEAFNPQTTNALPLLHRSISGGRFLSSHDYFCEKGANYFDVVGENIAAKLIAYRQQLRIWIA